jgi:diguanylate cyclase (GGDEF)-like protein
VSSPPELLLSARTDPLRLVAAGHDDDDLYRTAFREAPLALALLDGEGRFARVNDALCDLVGRSPDELLGRPYESLEAPGDGRRMSARALSSPGGWTICAWESVDERLIRLALYDPLTGVANRALLDDRLSLALRTRDRDGGVVAVLFCDVDGFKAVNDQFGHGFGDRLLAIVAARLTSAVRAQDTVARVGGDEFVIVSLLHGTADADALLVRVGEALGDAIREPGGPGLPLSVSVGMAVADTAGCTAEDLLRHADRRMYAVKRRRVPAAEA